MTPTEQDVGNYWTGHNKLVNMTGDCVRSWQELYTVKQRGVGFHGWISGSYGEMWKEALGTFWRAESHKKNST